MSKVLDVDLAAKAGLICAFSTRSDGNMARDATNPGPATDRRRAFLTGIGLNYEQMLLVLPSHSPNVEVVASTPGTLTRTVFLRRPLVTARFDRYRDGADGTITSDPSLSVGIVTGDCIPLMFWSSRSDVHGIIHVGLLGAINQIVLGLRRSAEYFGESVSDFRFLIGPSLDSEAFNLTQSGLWRAIESQVRKGAPHLMEFTWIENGSLLLNMTGSLRSQLVSMGVQESSIALFGESTGGDGPGNFYSHRGQSLREAPERFLAVIGYRER